jgi:hypothetical protein
MASLGDAVKTEQKKMGETCHGPLDRTIEVIIVAKSIRETRAESTTSSRRWDNQY